jgi:hypothetical protein
MSIIGLSMAVLPCGAEEDVEAGSAALRVDWPVYPRRAEYNTVAEGGNRRWAETARQNAFQSRWPRADQRTSGRRHRRRLTSPRTPAIREGNRAGHWRVMHASNASLSGLKFASSASACGQPREKQSRSAR